MGKTMLSDQEVLRRQQIIDRIWEENLERKKELERRASRTCHRGPRDSDWDIRNELARNNGVRAVKAKDDIDRRIEEFLRDNPMPPFKTAMAEIRALMRALYGSDEEASGIRTQVLAEEVLKELRGKWGIRVVSETTFTDDMSRTRAERIQRIRKELRRD